jgi:hypothetical protein
MVGTGGVHSAWGVRTSTKGGICAAATALLDHAVGEAYGYVQGESLKPYAAFPWLASQLPDHQAGEFECYPIGSVPSLRTYLISRRALPSPKHGRAAKQNEDAD